MKQFLEMRETKSREELVQLIGLPKSMAYSAYKERIPVHAVVHPEPLYCMVDLDKLESRFIVFPRLNDPTGLESNAYVRRDGALAPPESYAVRKIGVVFSPCSDPEDRQRFANSYYLQFWLGQRRTFISPVAFLFSTAEANAFDSTRSLHGSADLDDYPVIIPPEVGFYFSFDGTRFDLRARLRFWVAFYGLFMHAIC
jgi:hypothetical protein